MDTTDDPRHLRERLDAIAVEIAALQLDFAAMQQELQGDISGDERRALLDVLHAMAREMRALTSEARDIVSRLRTMPE